MMAVIMCLGLIVQWQKTFEIMMLFLTAVFAIQVLLAQLGASSLTNCLIHNITDIVAVVTVTCYFC